MRVPPARGTSRLTAAAVAINLALVPSSLAGPPPVSRARSRCPDCQRHIEVVEEVQNRYRDGFKGCILLGMPEHGLFLSEAAREMAGYRGRHGEYAKEWHQLGFSFVAGRHGYFLTDPGIYPTKQGGNRWTPKRSNTSYVILSSGRDGYVIQAVDQAGKTLHTIDQKTPAPIDRIWP